MWPVSFVGTEEEVEVERKVVFDGRGDVLTWVIREDGQQLWVVLVRDAWERRSDFHDALSLPNTCLPYVDIPSTRPSPRN